MKKLKLEELEVTTFSTAPGVAGERGTVRGNATPSVDPCVSAYPCHTTPDMDCTYGCTEALCETSDCVLTEVGCTGGSELGYTYGGGTRPGTGGQMDHDADVVC